MTDLCASPATPVDDGQPEVILAGLLQAPSAYNPAHHLSAALRRRSEVLARLRAVGVLTPAQLVEVGSEPLDFAIATSG